MKLIHSSQLILCSSMRLVLDITAHHREKMLAQGHSTWEPLQVRLFDDWLAGLMMDATLDAKISTDCHYLPLSPLQERLLWESAISESIKSYKTRELFDITGLAEDAIEANQFIEEWNLQLDDAYLTTEALAFLNWRKHFRQKTKRLNCLEKVRYLAFATKTIEQVELYLPSNILLAGFNRPGPYLKKLQETLEKKGVEVGVFSSHLTDSDEIFHIELLDQDAECRAAVAWAQYTLQKNPQARLGIIVPELQKLRQKMISLLDDALHPITIRPSFSDAKRCYNVSLGDQLNREPIIQAALLILKLGWQEKQFFQESFTDLLFSPYWSDYDGEKYVRASLDVKLKKKLPKTISWTQLLSLMEHSSLHQDLTQLQCKLNSLMQYVGSHQAKALPSAWSKYLKESLIAMNWPGTRVLSSREYQAVNTFYQQLDLLASLDSILGPIYPSQAIYQLRKLCQDRVFQTKTQGRPSIYIMNTKDTPAAPFDGLWVMGMNDSIWPPVPQVNPLIPANIQRQAGCHHASSEVEFQYAKKMHDTFIQMAPKVIFSSANKEGDRLLRKSPLMEGVPRSSLEWNHLSQTLAEKLAYELPQSIQDKPWQWLEDHRAPEITEHEKVSGGTRLIKTQAICPAWAFYAYRLHAKPLDQPVDGLNAMDRGSFLHQVLEYFWENKDSDYLNSLSDSALDQAIMKAGNQVIEHLEQQGELRLSQRFMALEKQRWLKLVKRWLIQVESKRPEPFKVIACEAQQTIEIEGVTIKVIVDRIDELKEGGRVVMDYKTGKVPDFKNWMNNKMTEPQLPFYAAFAMNQHQVSTIAFAKVIWDKPGFSGVAVREGLLQGVIDFEKLMTKAYVDTQLFDRFEDMVGYWEMRIREIVNALKHGDARVILEDERELQYCEVLPLLRLAERQLQFEEMEVSTR
jgi:probable DNA repair protein